jgi:hypothetical protein
LQIHEIDIVTELFMPLLLFLWKLGNGLVWILILSGSKLEEYFLGDIKFINQDSI